MRTIVFLILAFNVINIPGFSQFDLKMKLGLPDTLVLDNVEWVDANNDSLLDITVFSHAFSHEVIILFYQNVRANQMEYAGHINTGMKLFTYSLTDINSDNQMDIIASGDLNSESITTAFINTGEFTFERLSTPLVLRRGTKIIMDDLNLDGKKELIISGNDTHGPFLTVYQQMTSSWEAVYDSIKIETTEILIEDYNQDMYRDILIKGRQDDLSSYAAIIFNSGNFEFKESMEIPITEETTLAQSDFNSDGTFDFFIVRSSSEQQFLMSQPTRTHTFLDSIVTPFLPLKIVAADFNSDGKIDIQYTGIDNGTHRNEIKFTDSNEFSIYLENMNDQAFGDYDRDGDLDLLQATTDSIFLSANNTIQKNEIPGQPIHPAGYFVFDRLFIYWEKSLDDHTPANALTYDLALQSNEGDLLMGDFDLFNNKRTRVSHGNNGAHHFTLLKGIQGTQFNFFIQAVDNSFHAGSPIGGSCTSSPCQSEVILVPTCGIEQTILQETNAEALWFSFNKGFMGKGVSIQLPTPYSDTIFSFTPTLPGCASLKIYQINYEEHLIKKELTDQMVCQGAILNLSVEKNWSTIEWTSDTRGIFSTEQNITYAVTNADTITVKLTDGNGCIIERNTAIHISKPELFLSADKYQILKGESVQLHAEGGSNYHWTPGTGLNNTDIGDPLASPMVTTQYTVTLSDTIGCETTGTVLVKVENSAFVPTLFTPNNDGTNDFLKVYGLSAVQRFTFSIYNREGIIVYTSENPQEVISTGWNGDYHGVTQPAGVYQWKVNGIYHDGKKVLLNGKQSGSLVLLR